MESNVNKRTSNFSKSEENMLISLVKKYKHVIENKKTDSGSNQAKTVTWTQISKEFNSSGETFRNVSVLKNKYLNLKKRSLKNFATEKKMIYRTGGGPPIPSTSTSTIDNDIHEIIGSRMTGFSSKFDGDANINAEKNPVAESREHDCDDYDNDTYFDEQFAVIIDDNENSFHTDGDHDYSQNMEEKQDIGTFSSLNDDKIQKDWSKNSVDNLRTSVSSNLKVKNPNDGRQRDNTLKGKLGIWAKSKQDFLTIQQECHLKEAKQKLQHNEEKHHEEMKQKRELHELNIKMLKEEHELKMSLLRLQKEKLIKEISS